MCVCVTGVAVEGSEGHGSHLLLSCPEQPAQQHSQIPRRLRPLVQILIAHQQLQSHLSAATCQGKAVRLSAPRLECLSNKVLEVVVQKKKKRCWGEGISDLSLMSNKEVGW